MKKWILFGWVSVLSVSFCHSQSLGWEWSHIYGVHSDGTGTRPNATSVVQSGSVVSVVVENNVLRLQQTLADGTPTVSYTTGNRVSNFTSLISVGENDVALVYALQGLGRLHRFVQTNGALEVVRSFLLSFPATVTSPEVGHLIVHEGVLYLTLFSGSSHYLFRIEEDDSLTMLYSGSVAIVLGEDYVLLDEQRIVFSYKSANGHVVRCVSLVDGAVLWEQHAHRNYGIPLDYKVVRNGATLYTLALERLWIEGVGVDALGLKHIDAATGVVTHETALVLPNVGNCILEFNDMVYSAMNHQLYVSYVGCGAVSAVSVVALSVDGATVVSEKALPFVYDDELPLIDERAHLYEMADGRLVVVYKSYKDSVAKSNLYVAALSSNLVTLGTLEITFPSRNSSETDTHLVAYDDTRLVITGFIPDPDPSIFWEQGNFFTAMVNLITLSVVPIGTPVEGVVVYPNPAADRVWVRVPAGVAQLEVYAVTGKLLKQYEVAAGDFDLDLKGYSSGVYMIRFFDGTTTGIRKVVVR
jgi:hypothetical protein